MKDRFAKLLLLERLSASKFAEIIDVQASGISHILSGRNKPGYDLLVKILTNFPRISPDWLLLGKGGMYREGSNNDVGGVAKQTPLETTSDINLNPLKLQILGEKSISDARDVCHASIGHQEPSSAEIERVIVFHSDNTISIYTPRNNKTHKV